LRGRISAQERRGDAGDASDLGKETGRGKIRRASVLPFRGKSTSLGNCSLGKEGESIMLGTAKTREGGNSAQKHEFSKSDSAHRRVL